MGSIWSNPVAMKPVNLLPNLFTLGNAFCGLLALSKAIDALAYVGEDGGVFYQKMETACLLVFVGMTFDILDGLVARLTKGASEFGAQLDSFSDALTFGVVPAMLAKVLLEHEGMLAGADAGSRLTFLAAASFSLMAILRLVRFNLETGLDESSHRTFRGLPSPAAAGAVASSIWIYLILKHPRLEVSEGTPTPLGRAMGFLDGPINENLRGLIEWMPTLVAMSLPVLGILMVSRIAYAHPVAFLTVDRTRFFTLVSMVFVSFLLYLAPVPFLFVLFNGGVLLGVLRHLRRMILTSRAGSGADQALT